jgi:FixJ family two-component response regulator
LGVAGYDVESFDGADSFLRAGHAEVPGCVLLDLALPGRGGLDVQQALLAAGPCPPIVFLSAQCDVYSTVHAMKAGAVDFLTKPVEARRLLGAIANAIRLDSAARAERHSQLQIRTRIASLTRRETEVFEHVVQGRLNKQIAAELGTVEKTVKVHRARVMQKMHVRTLAELVYLAILAGVTPPHRTSRSLGH